MLRAVYGALAWEQAEPHYDPAKTMRLLVEPVSTTVIVDEGLEVMP